MTVERSVECWHASDGPISLREWLGLSAEEFARFVSAGQVPDGWQCNCPECPEPSDWFDPSLASDDAEDES